MSKPLQRLSDVAPGKLPPEWEWNTVAYWKQGDTWMLSLGAGVLGDLSGHEVTEHPDGTITVSPSILVTGTGRRHGYLRRGVWEPCADDEAPDE